MISNDDDNWTYPKDTYSCPVYLWPEEGGWCVIAARLPGACSQGGTVEEALANITEAITGALESYRDNGKPVPWRDVEEPACCLKRVVRVTLPPLEDAR